MDKQVITLLKTQCFIDGQWVGTPEIPVTNKATGEEIAKVPRFGTKETKQAIDAAEKAFGPWSKLLAKERAAILRRWFDLQIAHADELALLLTSEQGKPLAEAKGEIIYGASFTEFYAEEAKRIYGETIPTFKQGTRIV
ncbi:MAG TPA: aldehyde dehydrogenase family protein, partial [Hyphomicrobiaceae bacterium]|nr:aldehyde dehydrogenase family protein [Hyphomicrobiaceae bacterium]